MAPQRLKCGTSSWFGMSDTSDIWNIQQKRRKTQASFERFIHFSLMKHYNYIKENKHLFPFYKKASSPLKSKKKKKTDSPTKTIHIQQVWTFSLKPLTLLAQDIFHKNMTSATLSSPQSTTIAQHCVACKCMSPSLLFYNTSLTFSPSFTFKLHAKHILH